MEAVYRDGDHVSRWTAIGAIGEFVLLTRHESAKAIEAGRLDMSDQQWLAQIMSKGPEERRIVEMARAYASLISGTEEQWVLDHGARTMVEIELNEQLFLLPPDKVMLAYSMLRTVWLVSVLLLRKGWSE